MSNDISDETLLEEQQKQQEKDREVELSDLRSLLGSDVSRRVLRRILGRAGIFQTSFDPESDRNMAFSEGRRDMGLWLFSELGEANIEGLGRLIVELQKPQRIDETKV